MKALTVFRGVPIPVDYASTQTYALLAKRDGGKTYTTLKFEEQMCDAGLFFVTLDPVGKHWALRAGLDGSEKGGKGDVWVLGGAHGDVPLDASSGEIIADTVVEHPGRYVLDVSGFETDADQDRFATAFAKRLFRRKARNPGFPLLVILEEAEAFIPEKPAPGQQQMLGAFGRIMRQGRNHGLGMWMVAQRAQALNKGVLSQAEVLVVKQMAHKRDRDAVDDWVKANGTPEQREELMASLASLDQRDAWVWSPAWLRVFAQARVLPRVTFDSSASIEGHAEQQAVDLVPLDVAALGERITEVAEKTKADDPTELRRRIGGLQNQIMRLESEAARVPETSIQEVEVEVVREVVPPELRKAFATMTDRMDSLAGDVGQIDGLLQREERRETTTAEHAKGVRSRRVQSEPKPAPAAAARAPSPRTAEASRKIMEPRANFGSLEGRPEGAPNLKLKARRMLAVLAQSHPGMLTRRQVATQVGIKSRGSTFSAYLSNLRTAGFITEEGERLGITQGGFDYLGESPPAPQAPEEVRAMWRATMKKGARIMFDALVDAYPQGHSRGDLAELLGIGTAGSTFSAYLSNLRTNELIREGDGLVFAADTLFGG